MKYFFYAALAVVAVSCIPQGAKAAPLEPTDPRFCGEPVRDANGDIVRSSKVLSDFQKLYPCPSTGLKKGKCPGWAKDHVISLSCGGCDTIANLQWLPNDMKSSSSPHAKDRWERKVYYPDTPLPGTEECFMEIVK